MNSDQGFKVVMLSSSSPVNQEQLEALERFLDIAEPGEVKDLLANLVMAYQAQGDDPEPLSPDSTDQLHLLFKFLKDLS